MNSVLLFLNIGTPELLIVVLVIVIFFGPKKLPEIARGIGKGIQQVKNAASDVQREIMSTTDVENPLKDVEKEVKSVVKEVKDSVSRKMD